MTILAFISRAIPCFRQLSISNPSAMTDPSKRNSFCRIKFTPKPWCRRRPASASGSAPTPCWNTTSEKRRSCSSRISETPNPVWKNSKTTWTFCATKSRPPKSTWPESTTGTSKTRRATGNLCSGWDRKDALKINWVNGYKSTDVYREQKRRWRC